MKSQTQVIQFILFFLISISIFSITSSYLFSFSQSSQDRMLSSFRELVSSYSAGFLIYAYTNCKYCNTSNLTYNIPYQTFDNFHEVNATNNIVYIRSMPLQKEFSTSVHNLNFSTNFFGFHSTGSTPSYHGLNKTSIVLIFFNKTENKFIIGG